MLNLNALAQDTQNPYISLSEICSKTGFTEADCLIELESKGIAPIKFGDNVYLTADNILALFAQRSGTDFVNVQPISATTLDNSGSSELPLAQPQNDEEVRRVGKATVSKVSNKKRKKPYLVQWKIYFADGTSERKSKSFAAKKEAEIFADELKLMS